jgi:hypothetical protein
VPERYSPLHSRLASKAASHLLTMQLALICHRPQEKLQVQ